MKRRNSNNPLLSIGRKKGYFIEQKVDYVTCYERVILDPPYEGNITISITDIRSPMTNLVDSV